MRGWTEDVRSARACAKAAELLFEEVSGIRPRAAVVGVSGTTLTALQAARFQPPGAKPAFPVIGFRRCRPVAPGQGLQLGRSWHGGTGDPGRERRHRGAGATATRRTSRCSRASSAPVTTTSPTGWSSPARSDLCTSATPPGCPGPAASTPCWSSRRHRAPRSGRILQRRTERPDRPASPRRDRRPRRTESPGGAGGIGPTRRLTRRPPRSPAWRPRGACGPRPGDRALNARSAASTSVRPGVISSLASFRNHSGRGAGVPRHRPEGRQRACRQNSTSGPGGDEVQQHHAHAVYRCSSLGDGPSV